MKSFLPFLSLAIIVSSCSTAYQSGQTPDDVYFSPERPQNEYVQVENKRNKYRYEESEDDRYLRMKVRNRQLWSDLNFYYSDPIAYDYYYNRYHNVYSGSPWNHYNSWNYYYNPYSYYNPYRNRNYYSSYHGPQVIVVNPKAPSYNRPRQYNLNVYNRPTNGTSPRINNAGNSKRVFSNSNSSRRYSTPSRNTGSTMRDVFSNSNSSSSSRNTSTQPRTQTSSSSSNSNSGSGSSSSGKSGNAGVRKF